MSRMESCKQFEQDIEEDFDEAINLDLTTNINDLKECNIFIVTVPTPVDEHKRPDLSTLKKSQLLLEMVFVTKIVLN